MLRRRHDTVATHLLCKRACYAQKKRSRKEHAKMPFRVQPYAPQPKSESRGAAAGRLPHDPFRTRMHPRRLCTFVVRYKRLMRTRSAASVYTRVRSAAYRLQTPLTCRIAACCWYAIASRRVNADHCAPGTMHARGKRRLPEHTHAQLPKGRKRRTHGTARTRF